MRHVPDRRQGVVRDADACGRRRHVAPKFFDRIADSEGDIFERLCPVSPTAYGFAVFRKCFQLAEGCPAPVHLVQDDGNHARLASFVTLHGALYFNVIAILGSQEILADKQEDDLRGI